MLRGEILSVTLPVQIRLFFKSNYFLLEIEHNTGNLSAVWRKKESKQQLKKGERNRNTTTMLLCCRKILLPVEFTAFPLREDFSSCVFSSVCVSRDPGLFVSPCCVDALVGQSASHTRLPVRESIRPQLRRTTGSQLS